MVRLPHFIRYPKQHVPLRWLTRPKPQPPRSAPAFHGGALACPDSAAILKACRRLGLERIPQEEPHMRRYSIGAVVAAPDGDRFWLKVSGYKDAYPDAARRKFSWVPQIPGVPTPSIVRTADWTHEGIQWLAVQMTLAPSPAVEQRPYARENAGNVSDAWITSLKTALDRLAASDVKARRTSDATVQRTIARRWGADAPYAVDDWRPAHGDLQWSNVTAPNLTLLDWSEFKLAPRGYDAAKLICCSFYQPALASRLEKAFAEDLTSKSGRVALLLAAARRLNTLEPIRGTEKYQAWIKEKAARIISAT